MTSVDALLDLLSSSSGQIGSWIKQLVWDPHLPSTLSAGRATEQRAEPEGSLNLLLRLPNLTSLDLSLWSPDKDHSVPELPSSTLLSSITLCQPPPPLSRLVGVHLHPSAFGTFFVALKLLAPTLVYLDVTVDPGLCHLDPLLLNIGPFPSLEDLSINRDYELSDQDHHLLLFLNLAGSPNLRRLRSDHLTGITRNAPEREVILPLIRQLHILEWYPRDLHQLHNDPFASLVNLHTLHLLHAWNDRFPPTSPASSHHGLRTLILGCASDEEYRREVLEPLVSGWQNFATRRNFPSLERVAVLGQEPTSVSIPTGSVLLILCPARGR